MHSSSLSAKSDRLLGIECITFRFHRLITGIRRLAAFGSHLGA